MHAGAAALRARPAARRRAGDMPVALMFDGPSMGGFVCPATIASAQLWKMGQVAAKDEVHFRPMTLGAPPSRGAARGRAALLSTQRMPKGGRRSRPL